MKSKYWLYLFIICGIVEVLAEGVNNHNLIMVSKPLLMPLLAGYAYYKSRESGVAIAKALLAALFFSFLGDVILLSGQFILGLIAFLIGHVFYIMLNLRGKPNLRFDFQTLLLMLPIIGFSGFMLSKIAANQSGLLLPITLYSSMLCTLFYTGLLARQNRTQQAWAILMAGISLFIISDAMIAINRFVLPFNGAGVAIMASYIIAQLLLVKANFKSAI